jgi:hypothetical protein
MNNIKIKKIELLYQNQVSRRKIKVTLTNGTIIYIEKCYESWQQYGGTTDELRLTVPIADAFNDWLHGGEINTQIFNNVLY